MRGITCLYIRISTRRADDPPAFDCCCCCFHFLLCSRGACVSYVYHPIQIQSKMYASIDVSNE